MTEPRFAELFAGAGGLSMGLEAAGWHSAWHAEFADSPRAILTHHWPSVPLYGDVTTLDGKALTLAHGPIALLCGGSPCQDLSVAGKRAGMTEGSGTRSSLFFEQMRLWDETGADLCLWENVDGARSSNEGKDFAAVLRAFVGAAIAVPSNGWRSAGVAAGPGGVAAWRVLDAQYFGVPQRRRRVFVLGTRSGSVDPAQVLSLAESLRGDTPQSGEAGEGFASRADERAPIPFGWNEEVITNPVHRGGVTPERTSAITPAGRTCVSFDWQKGNDKNNPRPSTLNVRMERTDPLRANTVPAVIAFGHQNSAAQGASASAKCTPALDRSKVPAVLGFHVCGDGGDWASELSPTVRAQNESFGGRPPAICITGETTHALTHEGADASEDGTGRGPPIVFNETGHEKWTAERIAGSLNAHEAREAREAHTIVAFGLGSHAGSNGEVTNASHDAGGPTGMGITEELGNTLRADHVGSVVHGVPRRLTPRECERLMGWEDDHTLVPDAKGKLLSDAARYKACGNGVASPVAEWIGERLRLALEAQREAA